MNWSRIILVLLYSAGMYQCYAQSTIHRIIVADNNTLQVLVNASVSDKSHYYNTTTDTHGAFNCPFFSDSAQITIKHIGYETKTLKLTVASDTIFLRKRSIMLNVVDVIGNEYYNLHSATNINSTTIDHIQSASLKDVFNLLA